MVDFFAFARPVAFGMALPRGFLRWIWLRSMRFANMASLALDR